MLNAEKYKEKIESNKDSKLGCYIATKIWKESCINHSCSDFREEVIAWLLQECADPILTEEEKTIINDILKTYELFNHFNREKCVITKQFLGDEEEIYYLEIAWGDEKTATPSFWATNMFVGMDICKKYTLEELDLC